MAQEPPFTENEVLDYVIKAVLPGGRLFPSKHFLRERMPGREFDMLDARKVLCECKTVKTLWNDRYGSWNYDLVGKDIEGNELTIRIAIDDETKGIILVTGF